MDNYVCKIATLEDIIKKHDYEIKKAIDDKDNWIIWKEKAIEKSHRMQLRFGYKDEGVRRQRFISRASGKIEDEYITGLLKEEWIK